MARAGMRRWLAISVAVAGIAAAGCAKDDPVTPTSEVVPIPKGMVQCQEVYKTGEPVDPQTFGTACADGGEMIVPRPVVLDCANSKRLYWNKFAWGYEKEAMTLIEDDSVATYDTPAYEASIKCLKPKAAAGQKEASGG